MCLILGFVIGLLVGSAIVPPPGGLASGSGQ